MEIVNKVRKKVMERNGTGSKNIEKLDRLED